MSANISYRKKTLFTFNMHMHAHTNQVCHISNSIFGLVLLQLGTISHMSNKTNVSFSYAADTVTIHTRVFGILLVTVTRIHRGLS